LIANLLYFFEPSPAAETATSPGGRGNFVNRNSDIKLEKALLGANRLFVTLFTGGYRLAAAHIDNN